MTKDLQNASFTKDFVELKDLFGPPPIEQMLGKDLADATWEMKRYSRHKALVIERQYVNSRKWQRKKPKRQKNPSKWKKLQKASKVSKSRR